MKRYYLQSGLWMSVLTVLIFGGLYVAADLNATTESSSRVELQVSSVPCSDFDGDGTVGIPDFLQFVNHFGTTRSGAGYDAKYDLDGNDAIGISDFLIFVNEFGKEVDCSSSGGVTVTIPDANLRAVIEHHLGKAPGTPISAQEMATLREIRARHRRINDLKGLEYATNLERLNLGSNEISDLSPVSGLLKLRHLRLVSNRISDISPLSGLSNLRSLDLTQNRISDLSPTSSLSNLTSLWLGQNFISDISPLSGLSNLRSLDLWENLISDISVLADITELQRLSLENNIISNLAALAANDGLGRGDIVDVTTNPLDPEKTDTYVQSLRLREVRVFFNDSEFILFSTPQIFNDNVFVLPVTEDLAAGDLPLADYAKRFYGHFHDTFDFLVFVPSVSRRQLDSGAYGGAHFLNISNDVRGIGTRVFSSASRFGSAGNLQGAVYFSSSSVWYNNRRFFGHSTLIGGPALHEIMHNWANSIVPPYGHWAFNSANGILGGFDIATLVEYGGGQYRAREFSAGGWAFNTRPFSPIEMYLAGFIPPKEVPDLWVATDGQWLRDDAGSYDGESFIASQIKTYKIEDIIAEHGPRVPDYSKAQKDFVAAVILLVSQEFPATRKILDTLSNDALLFSYAGEDKFDEWYNFYEAAGGRGTITMDGLSQFRRNAGASKQAVSSFGTPPPLRRSWITGIPQTVHKMSPQG